MASRPPPAVAHAGAHPLAAAHARGRVRVHHAVRAPLARPQRRGGVRARDLRVRHRGRGGVADGPGEPLPGLTVAFCLPPSRSAERFGACVLETRTGS
eukprot:1757494-Prymnesium_polylepis.1